MDSTLYLNNVTCIDLAILDNKGLKGYSFNPEIYVTGEVTSTEQVVVDFSRVKKEIKEIIDNREVGLDHKLWVLGDFDVHHLEDGRITVVLGEYQITGPSNNFVLLPGIANRNDLDFGFVVQHLLTTARPLLKWKVASTPATCYDPVFALPSDNAKDSLYEVFSYTHGLPRSTSWGCQNIAHGHTSFMWVSFKYDITTEQRREAENILYNVVDHLNDAYLVNVEHSDDTSCISYTSDSRGCFDFVHPGSLKVIYLDKEPTIENIAEYVANTFGKSLWANGVDSFIISEGLWKGICVSLDDRFAAE